MDETQLPAVEELFVLSRDERGAPAGVKLLEDKLASAASGADPDLVLAVLESSKDLADLLLGVLLAVRIARDRKSYAPKFEKALLHLMDDHRAYQTAIQGEKQVFSLEAWAFNAYFEVLRQRPPDVLAIMAVLGSTLLNPKRADLMAAAVEQFNLHFQGDAKHQQAAEEVAELLADAVVDAELSPSTRIRAYEALVCGVRFKAAPGHRTVARPVFEHERARAAAALAQALEDKAVKPELREYVLHNLHTLHPESIGPLQDKGILRLGAVPQPEELVNFDWHAPDPVKAARAALALKPQQVMETLQKTAESDPRLLAAIFLAPFFARRGDWRPLAGELLRLIGAGHQLELRSGKLASGFAVGREAAAALLGLLRAAGDADEKDALEWTFDGLDACLARGLAPSGVCLAPVMDYLCELHSREHQTGGRLKKTVLGYLGSQSRPAMARFTAYSNYRRLSEVPDPEVEALAKQALANPKEDPEFIGLLQVSPGATK